MTLFFFLFFVFFLELSGYVVEQTFMPFFEGDLVTFEIQVSGVSSVYVAGSWNLFARNRGGVVDDDKYLCRLVGADVWRCQVLLPAGEYLFKFVFDHDQWYAIPELSHDEQGNAVFWVGDHSVEKEEGVIQDAHWSFGDIPFSNGFSAAKFNVPEKLVDNWSNHIYQKISDTEMTVNMVNFVDVQFSYQNGSVVTLSSMTIKSQDDLGYVDHTGIVRVRFYHEEAAIDAYFYSSFGANANNLMIHIDTSSNYASAKLIINWNPDIHVSQSGPDRYNSDIGTILVSSEFSQGTFTGSLYHNSQKDTIKGNTLSQEIEFWKDWLSGTQYPSDISPDTRVLYDQSLVILKMAQCLESGKSHGQILASLPPGMWNICWIRDGSYATLGLILSGHFEEAKKSLEFFLNAEVGKYEHFFVDGVDYGVGMPYQISVCRYFGDGSEESDGGSDPNIELDGFGLFLWAFETYINKTKDIQFLEKYWDTVKTKVGDVLVHVIDRELNITQKDSSIWERHIIPDGKDNGAKHFTFTTLTSIKGLQAASNLAKISGRDDIAKKYNDASDVLISGFYAHQIDPNLNIIKDSYERTQQSEYMDASVVEAINFDVVQNTSIYAKNTLEAFEKYLSMKSRSSGYKRTQGDDLYDEREWIVMDLRIASAYKKSGNLEKSNQISTWITTQSSLNYNIMAELYTIKSANYAGAIPMCGFGPGALILYTNNQ